MEEKEYKIDGIVDQLLHLQLTETGKIKIGQRGEKQIQTSGGKKMRLPEKLDHFIVVENKKDSSDKWVLHPVMSKLGNSPRAIPIRLLFNHWRQNLFTEFRLLNNRGKILCHGNGRKAWRKLEKQEKSEFVNCDPTKCVYFYKNRQDHRGCKWYGVLSCVIDKTDERIGSVFKFRTTSEITIQSLITSMVQITSLTNGILADIPLNLVIHPITVNPDSTDGSVQVYIVNIEWAGTKEELRKKAIELIEKDKKAIEEWRAAGIEKPQLFMQPVEHIDSIQDNQMLSEENYFDVELDEKDMQADEKTEPPKTEEKQKTIMSFLSLLRRKTQPSENTEQNEKRILS